MTRLNETFAAGGTSVPLNGSYDARIAFSFSCNKMHSVGTNGPRAARLIRALYGAL